MVQSDDLAGIETTLVALLTTSDELVTTFRLALEPSPANGLHKKSYLMLDKIMVVWRLQCGPVIGALTKEQLERMDAGLALVLGLDL